MGESCHTASEMNMAELAEACGVPEERLRTLFPDLKITEDFDVDAFMEKLTAVMDEQGEAEHNEEPESELDKAEQPA